jgi:hypothetical protein
MTDRYREGDTPQTSVYDSNSATSVMGLPKLLRAVASRLENTLTTSDGDLSRELLERAADRLDYLEKIAITASHVILFVSKTKGHDRQKAKIPIGTLSRLSDALNEMPEFRGRRIVK